MSVRKTGEDHVKSLRDGRAVYIDGERVADVTAHVAFKNAVRSAAHLYDYQARPENIEAMTFRPDGAPANVSRAWQMPRNHADTVVRRKALTAWSEQNYGFMGRSPDHLASALVGQRMGLEVFKRYSPDRAKAFADYFDYASRNDLFLTYVIINPQADRSKDWSQQQEDLVARIVDEDSGGITIRGAKMMGTSSIMANEVFVASLQPLKQGEEDLAFCCALPMNVKGMSVLSRKSYEAGAVSVYDNPLSSRYDENDAVIYFSDVKVPWERVFVHRHTDACRAQFHDTPGHLYQNYQAQIRLVVKLKFMVAIARRLAETIGTANMPQVKDQLGFLAAQAAMFDAMLHGMEVNGERFGDYWIPNRHYLYSALALSQDLYPKMMIAIRELAGGAFIMLPSSVRDFYNEAMEPLIRKTQRSNAGTPEQRVKFLKAAWDAIGSEFGSRHTQYEMFYAGARFVTTGHSHRIYDWDDGARLIDGLLSSYQLPERAAL
jgi:4-hydroxyphenylacetate 3-monooxygenase